MKKLLSIILAAFMFVSNTCVVFANENVEFYAYTTNTEGFDAYAKEELSSHIYAYYGYVNDTLKLGKGIKVYGNVNNPLILYPIWENNKIVATFYVAYVDGQYCGSYSEGNVPQLNHAMSISASNNPIQLVKTDSDFVYIINSVAYDMTNGIGEVLENENITLISSERMVKIDVANTMNYVKKTNARAATSWYLAWNYSEHNPSSVSECYAYCLARVLRNLGHTSYTKNVVGLGVSALMGKSFIMPYVNFNDVVNYIQSEGFSYNALLGTLTTSQVKSKIYDKRTYIMVGLSGDSNNHFGVITGYSTSSNITTYQIYDPQHNGTSGLTTMSASSKTYTNSKGNTYIWNAGYITDIK